MKTFFLVAAVIFSANVFAAPESYNQVSSWMQRQLGKAKIVSFGGVTEDGKGCALYLTNHYTGYFDVVVSLQEPGDNRDSIGLAVGPQNHANQLFSDGQMLLYANANWSNRTSINIVSVKMNGKGEPVLAEGTSNLRSIACRLGY